jgi:phosphoserine phosphatase RsbU/P
VPDPASQTPDQLAALEQEIASLQAEETRFFSFLHELAEIVSADRVARRVPEMIVDGVAKVVQAAGAALYLLDRTGLKLVPEFVTRVCPAVVPLPEGLRGNTPTTMQARSSYLKLHPVSSSGPILGQCYQTQTAVNYLRMDESGSLDGEYSEEQNATPVMVVPLNYGSKKLGVLAVANFPSMGAFPTHLFEVFRSVAEQSAFALGNAMLQEEALEKRRLESELRAASEVQRVLLPSAAPALEHFHIAATNVAARIVSGDYYDFISVDANHTGVVIADVSGKGIPASLVMTTCRGLLRGLASGVPAPTAALSRLNRMIYEDVKEDMFISLAYVMLRDDSEQVTLSRAGHDAPFLYQCATSEISRLEPPGLALGLDDGDVFELKAGDCLLLYTDGINEAENAEGDQFGLDRLEEVFRLAATGGPQEILRQVQEAIQAHVQGHPQSDDITLIAIQRK